MKMLNQLLATLLLFFVANSSFAQGPFNGYALYNSLNSNTSYLIDKDGNIAHDWSCSDPCNYTVQLKPNGNLIRGIKNTGNTLNGAAVAGRVQEVDQNCNIVWEFTYSSSTYVSHHDLCLLPNGNVLLTAWEVKNSTELTQAGYSNATSDKWPTHIIEVQQNGTGGQIVWEWHMWDHLVQDINATKDNYGVVASHPELMDVNAIASTGGGPGGGGGDWFHVNGLDYNPTLDQIVFSSRHASEIYIIDHSTTTAEAASHTGGNSGKGGDFLYRWGNPSNYGAAGTQTIPEAVHDPRWIPSGRPNAGYIQFFNNEGISGSASAVDAINPPINGYNYTLTTGQAYGPTVHDWRHNCQAFSSGQSASDRMTNGNTFVNVSNTYMYEVDSTGAQVWIYNAQAAKAFRYECDYAGITALLGTNPCGLTTGINEISESTINLYPNPTTGIITLEGISEVDLTISIFDVYGKLISQVNNKTSLDLSEFASGIYYVAIKQGDSDFINKKVSLIK
jgi:hypothetical protein